MPLPALALPLAVLLPRRRPLGVARIIERGIEGVGREMIAFQQAGGLLADAAVQLPAGVERGCRHVRVRMRMAMEKKMATVSARNFLKCNSK